MSTTSPLRLDEIARDNIYLTDAGTLIDVGSIVREYLKRRGGLSNVDVSNPEWLFSLPIIPGALLNMKLESFEPFYENAESLLDMYRWVMAPLLELASRHNPEIGRRILERLRLIEEIYNMEPTLGELLDTAWRLAKSEDFFRPIGIRYGTPDFWADLLRLCEVRKVGEEEVETFPEGYKSRLHIYTPKGQTLRREVANQLLPYIRRLIEYLLKAIPDLGDVVLIVGEEEKLIPYILLLKGGIFTSRPDKARGRFYSPWVSKGSLIYLLPKRASTMSEIEKRFPYTLRIYEATISQLSRLDRELASLLTEIYYWVKGWSSLRILEAL